MVTAFPDHQKNQHYHPQPKPQDDPKEAILITAAPMPPNMDDEGAQEPIPTVDHDDPIHPIHSILSRSGINCRLWNFYWNHFLQWLNVVRNFIPRVRESNQTQGSDFASRCAIPVVVMSGEKSSIEPPTFVSTMTYNARFGDPLVNPKNGSKKYSDIGWGCMHRSGQMMIAYGLNLCLHDQYFHVMDNHIGPLISGKTAVDGCASQGGDHHPQAKLSKSSFPKFHFSDVKAWFDDYSDRPFSIHKVAMAAAEYGPEPGQWLGPNTMCQSMHDLIKGSFGSHGVSCSVSHNGRVYVEELSKKSFPHILLFPTRMKDRDSKQWENSTKQFQRFLSLNQSIGAAGGKPKASYFMFFADEGTVHYLDPHVARLGCASPVDPAKPKTFPTRELDPCVALGFVCVSKEDLLDLSESLRYIANESSTADPPSEPMISVWNSKKEHESHMCSKRAVSCRAPTATDVANNDEPWEVLAAECEHSTQ